MPNSIQSTKMWCTVESLITYLTPSPVFALQSQRSCFGLLWCCAPYSLYLSFDVTTARKCSSFNISLACSLTSIRSPFKGNIFREVFYGRLQIRNMCSLSLSHLHKRCVTFCPSSLTFVLCHIFCQWNSPRLFLLEKQLQCPTSPLVPLLCRWEGYVQADVLIPEGEWQTLGAEPSYLT